MDPAGIFSTSYRQDQSLIRTRNQAITLLLFIVALFALPMFAEVRSVAVMTSMLITAVVVLGLQINTGLAGQVNIGQAAFMGVGAYSTAVLASKLHLPFWLALPAGGVFAALFGVIFGLAAVRIKGFYLALTTIAAQILFHFFVLNLPQKWLGGSNGITMQPAELFGFKFELLLSTRPEKFVGTLEEWEAAESALQAALKNAGHSFTVNAGDGAFYGPKIDILITDALEVCFPICVRVWSLGGS